MSKLITKELTMTSLEIAELTGKRHDHVLRDTRAMLVGLYGDEEVSAGLPDKDMFEVFCDRMGWGVGSPKLGDQRIQGVRVSRDARGFVAEIRLDYNHTMTLIAGYNVKLRKVIIDRWQELESGRAQPLAAPASKPSLVNPAKEFRAAFSIARLIGLDKNVSAISANQAVAKITGTNMLEVLGQLHLENEEQEQYFTPTELGGEIGISGRAFNALLDHAGLQAKQGNVWVPTPAAEGLYRVLDTGKRHGSGAMVQQIKWSRDVLKAVAELDCESPF